MSRSPILSVVALISIGGPALGHHSPAAYDPQAQIAIEGIVTQVEWANPHVYISLREQAAGNRVWLVEALAPTALKQFGWSPDTLTEGVFGTQ
jgi:hypothetical protein